MSHTVPDLPTFVNKGTNSIMERINRQMKTLKKSETDKLNTLQSMILCLEGLNAYAANLAGEALRLAENENDPKRKEELNRLHEICSHVPANPAKTMDEAVNSLWICWHLGPETGRIEDGDFKTFDEFYEAFAAQTKFIIDNTTKYNNMAAEAYAFLRPTPLLSVAIQGAIENAKDVTRGDAIYNTSGTFNIGLTDVVDSMMVIKKLVFEEKRISLQELKKAVDTNFENAPALHAMVQNKVPRFGSGSAEAVEMANKVASLIHSCYKSHKNFRGGDYTVGFWSVAQHVAYGSLSGALPSGRLAWQPFTPGLTPHPSASKSFLDNIRDVAKLNPRYMDNNIAFNVRLVPSAEDSREKTVGTMFSYVKTYFEQGGMRIQFNMINSAVLKDAMANPENYKNLVRISGYNAYFVNLNREMQLEIIERAEFGI